MSISPHFIYAVNADLDASSTKLYVVQNESGQRISDIFNKHGLQHHSETAHPANEFIVSRFGEHSLQAAYSRSCQSLRNIENTENNKIILFAEMDESQNRMQLCFTFGGVGPIKPNPEMYYYIHSTADDGASSDQQLAKKSLDYLLDFVSRGKRPQSCDHTAEATPNAPSYKKAM